MRIKQSIHLGVSACLLSACAVGPDYTPPDAMLPSQFNHGNTAIFTDHHVEQAWWKNFNDDLLSSLIEKTLQHNYTLHAAEANLTQARALYMNSTLNFLPQITSHSNFTDQKRSVGALNNRAFVPRTLSLYNAGFDAFWELDLFGRVRRSAQASNHDVEAISASLRDVGVSLIAEVARNYLELRGAQAQRDLLAQRIASQEKQLSLTQIKINNGRGIPAQAQTLNATLEETRAMMPELNTAIAQAIHRLSVLTGQLPTALEAQLTIAMPSPTCATPISLGNPAELLQRRADIQEAAHSLAAATARIGVATADLFPRVTFVGTLSLESNTLKGMVAPGAESYSLGPKISWAFLDLARVYARIEAADAATQGSVAQYHQTVLNALEETENALVAYREMHDKRDFLARAVEESKRAHETALRRYEAGVIDLLAIEESTQHVLQSKSQLVQSDTLLITTLIAVYKALGGGWESLPEK